MRSAIAIELTDDVHRLLVTLAQSGTAEICLARRASDRSPSPVIFLSGSRTTKRPVRQN